MSANAKHRITWEDDRLVGVDCYVKTKRIHLRDCATDGGSISAEDGGFGNCASCGQRLHLTWNVTLTEVQP